MNRALVDPIANAVLYEGYILYPYRPSTKNQQRWTFGGLFPASYCRVYGGEAWQLQAECLVQGTRDTTFEAVVRFLQLTHRQIGAIDPSVLAARETGVSPRPVWERSASAGGWATGGSPVSVAGSSPPHPPAARATAPAPGEAFCGTGSAAAGSVVMRDFPTAPDEPPPLFEPVAVLDAGGRTFQTWQEAEEREVPIGRVTLRELCVGACEASFAFAGGHEWEPLLEVDGRMAGVLVRARRRLQGTVAASAVPLEHGLFRVTLRAANLTEAETPAASRDGAQLQSFASTHAILGVESGQFVSLTDPPERWREAAAGCRNTGVWPVLVGDEKKADIMLASPIILYDYPRIAPESPGDYFDGTEVDEMLTLRILTLTDDEKRAMAAIDDRARALLARTEALAREQLLGLHGTVRDFRTRTEEKPHVELGS